MGGAVKQMINRIPVQVTSWAKVVSQFPNAMLKVTEFRAVAGAELRKHSTGRAREGRLRGMNFGGGSAQDSVVAASVQSRLDDSCVD